MSARADVLRAVRAAGVRPAPPPAVRSVRSQPLASGDLTARFEEMLREAGGVAVRARSACLREVVAELPARVAAHRILSFLPELLAGSAATAPLDDPHALADVDLAVFRADFGVAENGAVWVTDEVVAPRSVFFLPEHVAVLLDAADLVPDMHAAYARLGTTLPSFGCFIAGPSKTADIEQALVIGAHGPRSLTLVLVEPD